MKVLQVVSSFAPAYAYGGPARSAYKTSVNLQTNGHDVSVYTTDVFDEDSRYDADVHGEIDEDLDIHRFKTINNTLAYKYSFNFAPGFGLTLRNSIGEFDIVHIEEFRTPQAAMAHRYATKADVPYVLQTRGSTPRILKSGVKKGFDYIFGEKLFRDAARIIASSHSESSQYFNVFSKLNEEKIVHVPNGVDLETYGEVPSEGEFRSRHDLDDDAPVVLFVGRLDDMKGVDLLIDAFTEIRDATPDSELFLVGPDDGLQTTLENQVRSLELNESIHFVGPLYNDEKLEAYVDADVFVLPSKYRYESFGNVAIEAMACETAVVLTEKCGASEWIPAEAGRTVSASSDDIAAGVIELLSDKDLREQMGTNGRELVLKKFNWGAVTEDINEIYLDVIANDSSGL